MSKEYTIKWNCTLPGENFATETVLDLNHPIPTKEAYEGSDDTNKYILGRIGGHNVDVTCLPAGQSSAAAVVTDIPQPSVVATNQRQNEVETCRSEMQGRWDQSIRKNLGLPDGYQNVSVLMIKWADEIDQLEVKQEVNDIGKLFEDTFNYQTDLVEATKPHNVSSIGGHNGIAGLHQPNLWRDHETPQALCQGNEGCYYDLPHNAILPFTYRKPVVQRGGFSKVYSVEIHPSRHNFSKGTQSEAELRAKLESVPNKPIANLAFDYSTKRYKVIPTWLPNSKLVASVLDRRTIQLWDAGSKALIPKSKEDEVIGNRVARSTSTLWTSGQARFGSLVDLIRWMGSLRLKGPLALLWFASPVLADCSGSGNSDCDHGGHFLFYPMLFTTVAFANHALARFAGRGLHPLERSREQSVYYHVQLFVACVICAQAFTDPDVPFSVITTDIAFAVWSLIQDRVHKFRSEYRGNETRHFFAELVLTAVLASFYTSKSGFNFGHTLLLTACSVTCIYEWLRREWNFAGEPSPAPLPL